MAKNNTISIVSLGCAKNQVDAEIMLGLLKDAGFDITQATISRDIKELGLTKILTASGKYKYAIVGTEDQCISNKNVLIFNSALLGVAIITAVKTYPVYYAILYGFFAGLGYIMALLLFNKLCDRISAADLPRAFVGMPSKLLILALMSLASMAFIGGVAV